MPNEDKKKKKQTGKMGPLVFMRRYNKIILVVGGTLLMIVFLVPEAVQNIGSNVERRVVFYLDDKPVRGRTFHQAQRELAFLESIGLPLTRDLARLPGIDRVSGPEHWIMLRQLAERGGYVGSVEHGREVLTRSTDPYVTEGEIAERRLRFDRGARQVGFSEEEAGRVGAYFGGVETMLGAYAEAPRVSPLRTVALANRLLDRIVADVLFIPPDQVLEETETPTEQVLAELCYERRNALPGTGEFGFGYRQPAQVKFEYLALRQEVVEQTAQIDRILARKHFKENVPEYAGRVNKRESDVTYDEVRRIVLADLRNRRVDEIIRDIEREIVSTLSRSRAGLETQGRYYVLPEDWEKRRVDLEALAGKLADQFGINRPDVVRRAGEWIAIEKLEGPLDSVERSYLTVGKERIPLSEILIRLPEVEAFDEGSHQVGVAIGPLRDAMGNSYIVRVLQARPARPAMPNMPPDVEDPLAWKVAQWRQLEPQVQEQVIDDARRRAAYERLVAEQDRWLQRVIDEGPAFVAGSTRATFLREQRIARMTWDGQPPSIDLVGADEAFVEALHEVIRGLPPDADVVEQRSLPERTIIRPIPAKQGLAIAQVAGRDPLTDSDYRFQVGLLQLHQQVLARERDRLPRAMPFSFASLADRMNFRPVGRQRDLQDELDEDEERLDLSARRAESSDSV